MDTFGNSNFSTEKHLVDISVTRKPHGMTLMETAVKHSRGKQIADLRRTAFPWCRILEFHGCDINDKTKHNVHDVHQRVRLLAAIQEINTITR
jgi:hypothetical protein